MIDTFSWNNQTISIVIKIVYSNISDPYLYFDKKPLDHLVKVLELMIIILVYSTIFILLPAAFPCNPMLDEQMTWFLITTLWTKPATCLWWWPSHQWRRTCVLSQYDNIWEWMQQIISMEDIIRYMQISNIYLNVVGTSPALPLDHLSMILGR